jgi:hypothetical protein
MTFISEKFAKLLAKNWFTSPRVVIMYNIDPWSTTIFPARPDQFYKVGLPIALTTTAAGKYQGSILQNFISAENFFDIFSTSQFGQITINRY